MNDLPNKARVVIIGGGVIGCSVAYHLTKLGWRDVVLLERKQLTSGTTWHAAGLIGQLRASANMTRLARYSAELYLGLEEETGVATGMRQVGSISVALTNERREELYRNAAMARAFGVPVEELSPAEVNDRYPPYQPGWRDRGASGCPPTGRRTRPTSRWRWRAGGGATGGAVVRERVRVSGMTRNGRRGDRCRLDQR